MIVLILKQIHTQILLFGVKERCN